MELTNIDLQRTFQTNPTVFNAIIDVDAEITVPAEKSWRGNPIGISAILIPPPCPLEQRDLEKFVISFRLNQEMDMLLLLDLVILLCLKSYD